MAREITITIGVVDASLDIALPILYPQNGTVVGYVPLTNGQFHSFLSISQAVQPKPDVPPPVSDFATVVYPGDIIYWHIEEITTPQSNGPFLLSGLAIDLVSIYDKANSPYVLASQPCPQIKSANTTWLCQTNQDFSDNPFYPMGLSYRVQFSFVYNKNYYYFQFDPVITPKPKDGADN